MTEKEQITPNVIKDPLAPETIKESELLNKTQSVNLGASESVSGASASPATPETGTGATATKPANPDLSLGRFVSGTFAVQVINAVLPPVTAAGAKLAGYKIDRKDLELTKSEEEMLSPVMQSYLESINIDLNNPLYNLCIALGAVYAGKVVTAISKGEKVTKEEIKMTAAQRSGAIVRKMAENSDIKDPQAKRELLIKKLMKERKKSRKETEMYLEKNKHLLN